MRRVKGVFGAVRELWSSSSTAFSSIESELLVETLPRRIPNGVEVVGEPERPRVVEMDRRRRWSFMAAVVMGPGKAAVPAADVELLLWKRLEKAAEVTEPRRARARSLGTLPGLSFDIFEGILLVF
jgi:hypothetical protein